MSEVTAKPAILGLLATALSVGAAAAQVEVELPLDEARTVAALEATSGNAELAAQLARGLIEANPRDRDAWLILAAAELRTGDFEGARAAALRGFELSQGDPQRYEAARLVALAHANMENFSRAEFWLRRALTVAPTPEAAAQTTQDAAGLRRLNPWSANVRLSFAPSTNVNGGAQSELNIIDGVPLVGILSASAQALSGWVAQGDVQLSYRLQESRTSRTQISARADGRRVLLSEDAQEKLDADPLDTTGQEDFATSRLELTLSHDQVAAGGNFGLDASIGTFWSGPETDYHYLRLAGDRTVALDAAQALRGSLFFEQRFDGETQDPEDEVFGATAQYITALSDDSQAFVTLAWSTRRSDLLNRAYENWTLQVGYAHGSQIGPAQLSGSVGVQTTDYEDYFVGFIPVPGGRQDTRYFGSLEAVFPDYAYAGFAPLIRLNAGRTESNVSRFELDEFTFEFGLRSTF